MKTNHAVSLIWFFSSIWWSYLATCKTPIVLTEPIGVWRLVNSARYRSIKPLFYAFMEGRTSKLVVLSSRWFFSEYIWSRAANVRCFVDISGQGEVNKLIKVSTLKGISVNSKEAFSLTGDWAHLFNDQYGHMYVGFDEDEIQRRGSSDWCQHRTGVSHFRANWTSFARCRERPGACFFTCVRPFICLVFIWVWESEVS